jgi:hypothetical protein
MLLKQRNTRSVIHILEKSREMNAKLAKWLPFSTISLATAIDLFGYYLLRDHRLTSVLSMVIIIIGFALTAANTKQKDPNRAVSVVAILISVLMLITWLVRYLFNI